MKKYLLLSLLLLVVACGKSKVEDTSNEKEKVTSEKEILIVEKEIKEIEVSEKEKKEEVSIVEKEERPIKKADYSLHRSRLSNQVENREPSREKKEYKLNERAFFFTEIREVGDKAKRISHKWYSVDKLGNENLEATVSLEVKGNRWRTWSSKKLNHKGQWIVRVEDHLGNIMVEDSLTVK